MRHHSKLAIVVLSVIVTAAGISIPEAGAGDYGFHLYFGHGYHDKSHYGRQHYYSWYHYYGPNYHDYKSHASYDRRNYHHSDPYRNQDDVGQASVNQADAHFMAAALNYLGGQPNIARKQIHQSLKYDNSTASTDNLRRTRLVELAMAPWLINTAA